MLARSFRCAVATLGIVLTLSSSACAAEILFERKMDQSILERYETRVSSLVLPAGTSREEILEKVARIARNKNILRIELVYSPRYKNQPILRKTRLGRERARVAKEKEWRAYAMKNLACGKDFAGFILEGSAASLFSGYIFYEEYGAIGRVSDDYRGPKDEPVSVYALETRRHTISAHQFLRAMVREECRLEKTKIGWVIRSRDKWAKTTAGGAGHRLSWLSGERRAVFIVSVGGDPDGLLPLYGQKFPSTLTGDFKIDKTAWGREEMDFWLGEMKKATETLGPSEARQKLARHLSGLRPYVYVPIVQGAGAHDAPIELLKEQYEFLTTWWEAQRENTHWDKRMQRLVAKGWTPEDYAAAMRKRKEKEREARLNTPLTDDKVEAIVGALMRQTIKVWAETVESNKKTFGPDCGAKLEKIEEGTWRWTTRQSTLGPPSVETITGPKIERDKANKRYPLKATFTRRYYDDMLRKDMRREEVFRYDKLKDQWTPRGAW